MASLLTQLGIGTLLEFPALGGLIRRLVATSASASAFFGALASVTPIITDAAVRQSMRDIRAGTGFPNLTG